LPGKIRARRAERRPDREFAPARQSGRQQQVGDIGAGDQQHHQHRAHENAQRLNHIADDHLEIGLHVDAVVVAELLRQLAADRLHLLLRALRCDAGLEPRIHLQEVIAALLLVEGALHRQEDVGAAMREVRAHHADDFERLVVNRDFPADDIRIAVEAPRPVGVGEDDDFRSARLVFVLREPAAARGGDAEDVGERPGHARHRHALRIAAACNHRQLTRRAAQLREQRLASRPPVDVLGVRSRTRGARRLGVVDDDQLIRIGIRQRLEENAVEDREHGGGDADAQRERRDCEGRRRPAAKQKSQGEAAIIQKTGHSDLDLAQGPRPLAQENGARRYDLGPGPWALGLPLSAFLDGLVFRDVGA